MKVFDLGGNSKFRSVWERYYAEIWGFIYVVDAADTNRFEESKATLKEMISHKMMKDKPYIVVANKQDLAGAVPASKMKKILGLPRKVKIYDAIVTKIEGDKANEGVQTAISSLIGEIVENFQKIGQKRVKDMEEQKEIEEKAHQERLKRIAELRAKQAAEEEAAQKEAAEKAAAAEQKQQIEPNEEKKENEN
ncbi:ADP-ribosylation factor family protein [Tritrichomonas foetus]|uniref:ADP-ribosylation factor family protein n=1 Tax=Tritrichomonas foetus TaxID=1144522 RepID=A0A1J4K1N6_9EUKA|nr:ADP-ribosylation factor family protein [Tritrichomonas foetus]|eukprot:OHT03389.1 ADP-ribosylation factor family protein [Tritrichomonas foetus]